MRSENSDDDEGMDARLPPGLAGTMAGIALAAYLVLLGILWLVRAM